MTKRITIFLIIIIFTSCKKYGDGYVKGTIRETDTGNPIQGQKLVLCKWKTHPISGKYVYERIDSTTTTGSGEYAINFHKKTGNRYDIFCPNQDYYPNQPGYGLTFELLYKKTTKDFDLEPVSYVKIHLHKTQYSIHPIQLYLNSNDYSGFYGYDSCNKLLPEIYKVHGVVTNHIYWRVIDENKVVLKDSTLDLKINRGDTLILYMTVD